MIMSKNAAIVTSAKAQIDQANNGKCDRIKNLD